MEIKGTRFGTIVCDEKRLITMPRGLIGFASETRFILLEPPAGRRVAWLQSANSPELAFPIITSDVFGEDYPSPDLRELGKKAQLARSADDSFALLVIVAFHPKTGRIANLLAPIVVNLDTRTAAQVVLDSDTYSAATPWQDDRPTASPVITTAPVATPAEARV